MSVYLDTNALVRLHLNLAGSGKVLEILADGATGHRGGQPVTDLVRCEVTNAIHRMMFESRAGGGWRVTTESAAAALACFHGQLEEGTVLRRVPLQLTEIEGEFDRLSAQYTPGEGYRTYDILHVASALHLRSSLFVSFDAKTNLLARRVGLTVI